MTSLTNYDSLLLTEIKIAAKDCYDNDNALVYVYFLLCVTVTMKRFFYLLV